MAEVRLEATSGGSLEKLEAELRGVQEQLERLKKIVESVGGKPLDLPTDPAEADVKRLVAELARLEGAFKRAEQSVSFARVRNELEGTSQSARRLANAEATLAARGKELIDFSRRLPPELAKGAAAMDRLEKQTEQAAAAFKRFQAATVATGRGFGSLIGSINSLRAGLGAFIAALGIQQLLRFGRALVQIGADAVETKAKYDVLLPALKSFTGSTELAEETARRLTETAARLRVPLTEIVPEFSRIAAGAQRAGLSQTELINIFEQVTGSARAFGSDVSLALKAVSDTLGKGTASAEEFKRQLGDQIPNSLPALAEGLSQIEGRVVTVADVFNRFKAGSLDSATAVRALAIGLEELNGELIKARADTLAGDLGALSNAGKDAQVVLAEGFEPALRKVLQAITELLEQNPDLIRSIGEISGRTLDALASTIKFTDRAIEGWGQYGKQVEAAGRALQNLPFGALTSGFAAFGKDLESLGKGLSGVASESEKQFAAIEEFVRKAFGSIADTAEENLENVRGSFEEQAKAAGLAAEDIEATQLTLADRVGEIAEKSVEFRRKLEKALADDIDKFGAVREKTAAAVAAGLIRIFETQTERQKLLVRDLVEETKAAAEERIAAEEKANAEIAAFLDGVVEKARAVGQERAAADAETADKIEEIERELQEKLDKLREEAAEKLRKPKVDREEVAKDLLEKIVAAERDAAEKIRAEQDRIAENEKKAADARIKEIERVIAALEKSADAYSDILKTLEEIANTDTGGGDEKEAKGFAKVKEDVEELRDELDGLIVTLEQVNAGLTAQDPGEILSASFSDAFNALGEGADLLDQRFGSGGVFGQIEDGAQQAGDALRDALIEQLKAGADAAEGLSGSIAEQVQAILSSYTDLAEGGQVTREDIRGLAEDLKTAFAGAGQAIGDPIAEIRQQLEGLGESQDAAGEAAVEAGKKQEEAVSGVKPALDDAKEGISQVGDAWEQVGEGVERGGIRLERGADGLIKITDATKEAGEAAEEAAPAVEGLGTAAESAADPLKAVADAAKDIPDEIVAEGQPDALRELGKAAGEVAPQVQLLAEPVVQIAEGLNSLAESLPTIAEQVPTITAALPELQASLESLLGLLAENPVDLEAAAAQLTSILTSLEGTQASISTLSETLPGVQAALEPLLGLALEAADDDRLGRIAGALERTAAAVPAIPEPIKALADGLKAISEGREETVKAIDGTRAALEALGSEELKERLDALVTTLGEVREKTDELGQDAEKIRTELERIEDVIPDVVNRLDQLADSINGRLLPALTDSRTAAEGLVTALKTIPEAAQAAADGLKVVEEVGKAAIDRTTESVRQLREQLQAAAEDARALAEAMSTVSLP